MRDFLSRPETYGLAEDVKVHCIETHASLVFLAGDRAYKLKKRVALGFLDFRTLAQRKAAVENELRLNRRTAPQIYLGACPIRITQDGLVLGRGDGEIADWLVEMCRFPAEGLFARLADEGHLTLEQIEKLAAEIAAFHDSAEVSLLKGGVKALTSIVRGNDDNLKAAPEGIFAGKEIATLRQQSLKLLAVHQHLIKQRGALGFVRHCHGDLHLGNVTLIDDSPVIFDCLEFSADMATIDVLYDLAFLLMDLSMRSMRQERLSGFANRALNVYLDHVPQKDICGMLEGLSLLGLFMATRAAIRAKVIAMRPDGFERKEEARTYLQLALSSLAPDTPRLIAFGGLSGTGKSTVAKALSPQLGHLGAVHLRSDIIRKRLIGATPLTRLPETAYTSEVTAQVYDTMLDQARQALEAGHPVILDAVFARETERDAVTALARSLSLPFDGFWLEAPAHVLEERIQRRWHVGLDASDADAAILKQQLTYDPGHISWVQVDAADDPLRRLERVLALTPAMK